MPRDHEAVGVEISLDPDPVIERYKQDIDRTLIRANLQRTPEQRLEAVAELDAIRDDRRHGTIDADPR